MEVNPKDGYYSLGLNTLKVPMTLFDENRQRLANALRSNPGTPSNAVVLLQAGGEMGKETKYLNLMRFAYVIRYITDNLIFMFH